MSDDVEVRGRKDYRCWFCDGRIRKHAKHWLRRGFTEDGPWTMRMHAVCHDVGGRTLHRDDYEDWGGEWEFYHEDLGLPIVIVSK